MHLNVLFEFCSAYSNVCCSPYISATIAAIRSPLYSSALQHLSNHLGASPHPTSSADHALCCDCALHVWFHLFGLLAILNVLHEVLQKHLKKLISLPFLPPHADYSTPAVPVYFAIIKTNTNVYHFATTDVGAVAL